MRGVVTRPVLGEAARHVTGDTDQRKAQCEGNPRIDMLEQLADEGRQN